MELPLPFFFLSPPAVSQCEPGNRVPPFPVLAPNELQSAVRAVATRRFSRRRADIVAGSQRLNKEVDISLVL